MCDGHQGAYWRRFVFTKELMHVFDEPAEKAGDDATFDIQIAKFKDPRLDRPPPQYVAEMRAMWRALAVLCPEQDRRRFKEQPKRKSIGLEVIAASLRLPSTYVHAYMHDDFEAIIASMK